jgi:hypothetical protein
VGSSPIGVAEVPSSRGLGHRPFTAVTRVRIPLGLLKQNNEWYSYKMKFYYFGGVLDSTSSNIDYLESNNFDGVLFTYNPYQGDFFVRIAKTLNHNQKIEYMVAIRPHTISAQYLCMINQSISEIQDNRLQINLISGHIKPHESDFNGIIGDITDHSSTKDRTNYLINYIQELSEMKNNTKIKIPDFYVSCTNIFAYNKASELNQKIILPYEVYKNKYFFNRDVEGQTRPGAELEIKDQKIMLAIGPILRATQEEIDLEFPKNKLIHIYGGGEYWDRERITTDTEYFTFEEFANFIQSLESEGINEILLNSGYEQERPKIIEYVKKYKDLNNI